MHQGKQLQASIRSPSRPSRLRPLLLALSPIWGLLPMQAAMADDTAAQDVSSTGATRIAPVVVVIGTTPIPGVGLTRDEIPAPVQTATGDDFERSQAINVGDFMNRSLGSVHVNEIQGNPFQPDVNYRGYTASPLLGTPQGLSVYLDGVRLNQPFGDVVSWDLIPHAAISSINLMPGSNPLFGLNTLGGALSIQTKTGRSDPGTSIEAGYGSHARRSVEFEHGGFNEKGLDWYLAGNLFKENGWRDASPSEVKQIFSKLGWQDARTELRLTLAHADNQLTGNGLQEERFLSQNYSSVYTKPDITNNRSTFLNLTGRHDLSNDVVFSGNAYYREIRSSTFNGDLNEQALDQSTYLTTSSNPNSSVNKDRNWLASNGYGGQFPATAESSANTPFPYWRCIAQAGRDDEPNEKCNALLNRTESTQRNSGLSGQLTFLGDLAGRKNQFTVGGGYDESRVSFSQSTELGYLNPDRSVTGVGAFLDHGTDDDGNSLDARVNLSGRTRTWSLYGTDTWTVADAWHLSVSGRYNRTAITNRDNLNPGGGADSLDGNHRFSRFNPAVGITFTPSSVFNAYLGYSEGSRAPTSIELGCANPDNPCKLPNAMAGDPLLQQVVAKTWEGGVRGTAGKVAWNAGVFHTVNYDDILFVADDQNGFGYFKNYGKTRRQGVELGLSTKLDKLSFGANYTFLDATYQSSETVNGTGNSTNDTAAAGNKGLDGNIHIQPGDRIPLIPRHMLKLFADYQATQPFSVGLNMIAVTGSYARGNENNAHQGDGSYYFGSGKIPGYAVFNLVSRYQVKSKLELFGQINNLFDQRYYTAAQLGPTGLSSNGNFVAQPYGNVNGNTPIQHATFVAPGAARSFFLGVRYRM